MKIRLILLLLLAYAVSHGKAPKPETKRMVCDDLERTYHVVAPATEANQKYALVILLHGGGGRGSQVLKFTKFDALARKEHFFVVAPDGYKKNWNDGRIATKIHTNDHGANDVKFISQLIDKMISEYSIDPNRVFVTGISNGAMMSHYLAWKLSDKIAAIAPVCGSIPENLEKEYKPGKAMSVLMINGTEDKLVPYNGGPVISERAGRGRVISAEKTVGIWKSFDGCATTPDIGAVPDSDTKDGCRGQRYTYAQGLHNTKVIFIKITGGGHTWPGGSQYLPKGIVGRVCRDFYATEEIWEFFKGM